MEVVAEMRSPHLRGAYAVFEGFGNARADEARTPAACVFRQVTHKPETLPLDGHLPACAGIAT